MNGGLLPVVLIATVANVDNLGIGVALGVRGVRVEAIPNLIIAAATMTATAAAMSSGRALSRIVPASTAASLGSVIIIAVGAATVRASVAALRVQMGSRVWPGSQVVGRHARSDRLSYREALVLGLALSLNNVGSGIGSGVAGVQPLATTLLAGAFSVVCLSGGSSVGRSLGRPLLGEHARLASGLALLAIGIAMLSGVL
jgi:putative Mn2+ efflux pump MntP